MLDGAGLPSSFWPIAARFFCCARNFEVRDGDSAWHRRHSRGHLPPKELIPFGALVGFRPDRRKPKWKSHGKFAPNAVPGIFLGWHMQYGHVFRGEYLVASLRDCKKLNLRYDRPGEDRKLPVYRVTELVFDGNCVFPLKATYDAVNPTLEGAPPEDDDDISYTDEDDDHDPSDDGDHGYTAESATFAEPGGVPPVPGRATGSEAARGTAEGGGSGPYDSGYGDGAAE